MSDPIERTPSGAPVYRHEPSESADEMVSQATPYLRQIEEHIGRHIGNAPNVFHEVLSTAAHIDLHIVPPTPRLNQFTIITSGMSSRPMNAPAGSEKNLLAELIVALPPDWPGMNPDGTFAQEAMKDERAWWPFRWIKMLARMPHEHNTWLHQGHTIPNGDPATPFADNTSLCCMLLVPPLTLSMGAQSLRTDDGTQINFWALCPIYREEMELKLRKGLEPVIELLDRYQITELINPVRKNLCRKKFWPFN